MVAFWDFLGAKWTEGFPEESFCPRAPLDGVSGPTQGNGKDPEQEAEWTQQTNTQQLCVNTRPKQVTASDGKGLRVRS